MDAALDQDFDVIVVGSGAGGGMTAYELCRQGLKVLMLEAGRDYDPLTETPMFEIPGAAPLRGARTPDKPKGYYDATVDGGWEVPGEPYTNAPDTDEEFMWWRPRMLGGRTNHWGRISLRFGAYDFKYKDRDGLGVNWPMTYGDLESWYDKTEELIGVTGDIAGLTNTPDSPAEILHELPPIRAHEIVLKRAYEAMGIPVIGNRVSILTREHHGRAACFFATPCKRGCSIRANFQSTTVLIPPAMETGNLTIITNAMVYGVDTNESGLATGVGYVDRLTGERKTVNAKAVALAAGACETARILLNSNQGNGVANSSGLVGKYIMDTVGARARGHIPILAGLPPRNDDGLSAAHIYVPWWGYDAQARGELDFARGYHVEVSGGCSMPQMTVGDMAQESEVEFGAGLRGEMKRLYGSYVMMVGRGEMIPNEDCYLEIDPTVKDKWGIPVPRFNWKWGEQDIRQAAHMTKTFREIFDRLGGTILQNGEVDGRDAIEQAGSIIHEVGGARMGETRETSVTNPHGQTWDVPNLYIMDGAVFASNPDKNPTLTILALAMRNSAHLATAMKTGGF